jgi:hypothetical protein
MSRAKVCFAPRVDLVGQCDAAFQELELTPGDVLAGVLLVWQKHKSSLGSDTLVAAAAPADELSDTDRDLLKLSLRMCWWSMAVSFPGAGNSTIYSRLFVFAFASELMQVDRSMGSRCGRFADRRHGSTSQSCANSWAPLCRGPLMRALKIGVTAAAAVRTTGR